MKLTVLASGKLRDRFAVNAIADYKKRIARYTPLEIVEVTEAKGASRKNVGDKLLSSLKTTDRVILLDERGRNITSPGLAKIIKTASHNLQGRLVFVVGGPFGVSKELRERADDCLAFGAITLPHELARLLLIEQIYRATSIISGSKYHHE